MIIKVKGLTMWSQKSENKIRDNEAVFKINVLSNPLLVFMAHMFSIQTVYVSLCH